MILVFYFAIAVTLLKWANSLFMQTNENIVFLSKYFAFESVSAQVSFSHMFLCI